MVLENIKGSAHMIEEKGPQRVILVWLGHYDIDYMN